MRNIVQYPIDDQDLIQALEFAQAAAVREAPFSTHGMCLYRIQQYLIDNYDTMNDIAAVCQIKAT